METVNDPLLKPASPKEESPPAQYEDSTGETIAISREIELVADLAQNSTSQANLIDDAPVPIVAGTRSSRTSIASIPPASPPSVFEFSLEVKCYEVFASPETVKNYQGQVAQQRNRLLAKRHEALSNKEISPGESQELKDMKAETIEDTLEEERPPKVLHVPVVPVYCPYDRLLGCHQLRRPQHNGLRRILVTIHPLSRRNKAIRMLQERRHKEGHGGPPGKKLNLISCLAVRCGYGKRIDAFNSGFVLCHEIAQTRIPDGGLKILVEWQADTGAPEATVSPDSQTISSQQCNPQGFDPSDGKYFTLEVQLQVNGCRETVLVEQEVRIGQRKEGFLNRATNAFMKILGGGPSYQEPPQGGNDKAITSVEGSPPNPVAYGSNGTPTETAQGSETRISRMASDSSGSTLRKSPIASIGDLEEECSVLKVPAGVEINPAASGPFMAAYDPQNLDAPGVKDDLPRENSELQQGVAPPYCFRLMVDQERIENGTPADIECTQSEEQNQKGCTDLKSAPLVAEKVPELLQHAGREAERYRHWLQRRSGTAGTKVAQQTVTAEAPTPRKLSRDPTGPSNHAGEVESQTSSTQSLRVHTTSMASSISLAADGSSLSIADSKQSIPGHADPSIVDMVVPPDHMLPSGAGHVETDGDHLSWEEWSQALVACETANLMEGEPKIKEAAQASATKRIRQLSLRRPVPDKIRGKVWQLVCGGEHAIQRYVDQYPYLCLKASPHDNDIIKDINRTFPAHAEFMQQGGVGQENLRKVNRAHANFDPELGYCQGMGYITAVLLLHLPEEQAFGMLAYIMQDLDLRSMYMDGLAGLQLRLHQLHGMTKDSLPHLAEHLEEEGCNVGMFAPGWFLTLYGSKFPLPLVYSLMDVYLVAGFPSLLKFAVALLKDNYDALITLPFDDLMKFFRGALPRRYLEGKDRVREMIEGVKVKDRRLKQLEKEFGDIVIGKAADSNIQQQLGAEGELIARHQRLLQQFEKLEKEHRKLAKDHETLVERFVALQVKQQQGENDHRDTKIEMDARLNHVATQLDDHIAMNHALSLQNQKLRLILMEQEGGNAKLTEIMGSENLSVKSSVSSRSLSLNEMGLTMPRPDNTIERTQSSVSGNSLSGVSKLSSWFKGFTTARSPPSSAMAASDTEPEPSQQNVVSPQGPRPLADNTLDEILS
eukprot:Clim_evm43s144 gene=Clim_evmTU43s144